MEPRFRISGKDLSMIYHCAIAEAVRYFRVHSSLETMVLGVSGGIDSAVVAALAHGVIGQLYKEGRGIKLMGYSLPLITNEDDELERAKVVGSTFCTHFGEVDNSSMITELVKVIDNSLFYEMYGHEANRPHASKIRTGNIKARLRMMYLYDKAAKYKGLVLGTDNLTEYLLGFWTLHGDVGDFGFIQNLWKTEVYAMAEWMIAQGIGDDILGKCMDANPTDGLGVSDGDVDQLFPTWKEHLPSKKATHREAYKAIDETLIACISPMDRSPMAMMIPEVMERYHATDFKRENPFNIPRDRLI